jgi:hypothetical protein
MHILKYDTIIETQIFKSKQPNKDSAFELHNNFGKLKIVKNFPLGYRYGKWAIIWFSWVKENRARIISALWKFWI